MYKNVLMLKFLNLYLLNLQYNLYYLIIDYMYLFNIDLFRYHCSSEPHFI